MKILAFDLGTNTGAAFLGNKQLKTWHFDYSKMRKLSMTKFLNSFCYDVRYLVEKYNPDIIACEVPSMYSNQFNAGKLMFQQMGALRVVISSIWKDLDGDALYEVSPSQYKALVKNKGNCSKHDYKQALEKMFPEWKDAIKSQDIADAIGVALVVLDKVISQDKINKLMG
jgi:Holliday junction resolvasome RuvABC endonuclease subunit